MTSLTGCIIVTPLVIFTGTDAQRASWHNRNADKEGVLDGLDDSKADGSSKALVLPPARPDDSSRITQKLQYYRDNPQAREQLLQRTGNVCNENVSHDFVLNNADSDRVIASARPVRKFRSHLGYSLKPSGSIARLDRPQSPLKLMAAPINPL